MTTDPFKVYVEEIVRKRTGGIFAPTTLILLDKAASHKLLEIEKVTNAQGMLLPGGCTSLVKPPDVAENKPFKTQIRGQWKKRTDQPVDKQ